MNITVTTNKPESGQLVATLTISKKDVDGAVARTYREIAQRYAFQGFRRGRAPRPVIDGIVGRQNVLADATNALLQEAEPLMLNELDVVPLNRPDYGEPDLVVEKKDYVVEIKLDVAPDATLDSYEPLEIEMPPAEASEADVDARLAILASYRTTFEDVEEDRGAEAGDRIIADVENIENMREYEGENRSFSLDNPAFHKEFLDGLAGMKVGDEKEISWTVSAERDGESHEATFACKVKVNALRVPVVPEITEESVQSDYGFDSLAELREAVKGELDAERARTLPALKEDRLVEACAAHLVVDEIPEPYINRIYNEIGQEFVNSLQRQGMSLDFYLRQNGISSEDLQADMREQADERARQSLALDALAAHLELEPTEEELRQQFLEAGVPEADVDGRMEEFVSGGSLPALKEAWRRSKALEWLVDHAIVTVVSDEDEEDEADDEADA